MYVKTFCMTSNATEIQDSYIIFCLVPDREKLTWKVAFTL